MDNAMYFIIPFLAAFVVFRGIIHIISKPLSEITIHTREGVKFHHLHYGCIILLLGILQLLAFGLRPFALALLGFGFGMIVDEYVPSLSIPEPEPFSSRLYRGSFIKTAVIFLAIAVMAAAIPLIRNL